MDLMPIKDEKFLSADKKNTYYQNIRSYAKSRKLTNTTIGAVTIAPKLKTYTVKLVIPLTQRLAGGEVETRYEGWNDIPDGPVIFAHTHQGVLDNFAWMPATNRHCILLHSKSMKPFLKFIQLNTGLVIVDKEDKRSRKNATWDMISLLLRGHSIAVFPESAWNLSPNKLHLPLNFGFLNVAQKSGCPVIPVVDEYTYIPTDNGKERITKVHCRCGSMIYVNKDDDLNKKLTEYQEQISTLRYEMIEQKGLFRRKDILDNEYPNWLRAQLNNLKFAGIDIDTERRHIWGADDEFYKYFPINEVLVKGMDLERYF